MPKYHRISFSERLCRAGVQTDWAQRIRPQVFLCFPHFSWRCRPTTISTPANRIQHSGRPLPLPLPLPLPRRTAHRYLSSPLPLFRLRSAAIPARHGEPVFLLVVPVPQGNKQTNPGPCPDRAHPIQPRARSPLDLTDLPVFPTPCAGAHGCCACRP